MGGGILSDEYPPGHRCPFKTIWDFQDLTITKLNTYSQLKIGCGESIKEFLTLGFWGSVLGVSVYIFGIFSIIDHKSIDNDNVFFSM